MLWAVVALAAGMVSTDVRAQEPLRWKFKLGDKLNYHMVQEMTLATRGEPVDETTTPLHQEMDMTWTVEGVKDEGEAVIEQKFHDVKLKMTGPRGERIEYDSAATSRRPAWRRWSRRSTTH